MPTPQRLAAVSLLGALLLGGCEGGLAWLAGVQTIPVEALYRLLDSGDELVILDVSAESEYRAAHIPGSIWVGLDGVEGFASRPHLEATTILVTVCRRGHRSVAAAASLGGGRFAGVHALLGGVEAWRSRGLPIDAGGAGVAEASLRAPPRRSMSLLSQVVIVLAAYVIKPLYLLLTAAVVLLLWRTRDRSLVLLRHAAVLFFIGEGFCALNFLFARGSSDALDFIHGLGMVGMNALLAWGFVLLFDDRVTHYLPAEKVCVFQRLCGRCWKRDEVGCGLHKTAEFAAPALAFFALVPLSMPLRPFRMVLPVFGTDVLWVKSFLNALLEFRIYPLLAAVLFLVSFALVRRGKTGIVPSMAPFFAGVGFFSYSLFRFALVIPFRADPAWADWWEEVTELILVGFLLLFLATFQRQLGLRLKWWGRRGSEPQTEDRPA